MKQNTLKDLRNRKAQLQKEVAEMESLLTFENKKESLSLLTNGFTDQFLSEKTSEDGSNQLALKTGSIVKGLGNVLSGRNKKSIVSFDHSGLSGGILETTLKLGSAALVSNIAKKNLKSSSWKKKALGLALVYFLPVALRVLRSRLESYQTQKSLSSIKKLI
ncbi:phosphoribosyl-ATP pyrophosphatase [Bergeyella sp. RCAD1439]|uniref:phosphoribosyl-ATP pyrophosphatase n=1 Tax=Bergeyella anatis TaxID=3113737 RepID=UPI002E180FD6|nr:phosphoribosyl-ATP pyrophosphatase [Bergeyella sp. RCAD1439]